MIISSLDALQLPKARLTEDELECLHRAEALISAAIQDQFSGVPFAVPVPLAQVQPRVLYELKRRAERAGWAVTLVVDREQAQLTFDVGRVERVVASRVRALRPDPYGVPPTAMAASMTQIVAPPALTRPLSRVISLALFGDGPYWDHLPAYVRAHCSLFPGYGLWIHVEPAAMTRSKYGRALQRLSAAGLVRIVDMPVRDGQGKCEKMLWRLAPAWDESVDYVFCRDADSLPTWRERLAVEEFLARAEAGQVDAHALADNVAHAGVMGGMCGFRAARLRKICRSFDTLVRSAEYSDEQWDRHGADQDVLNRLVAGPPRLRVFEHAIFAIDDECGVARVRRGPTIDHAASFSTTIAPCDVEVPASAAGSDRLIRYIGAADSYSIKNAVAHYDQLGSLGVMAMIRECES